MNILSSIYRESLEFFEQNFFSTLTAQQKKISAIALIALSGLATCYVLYFYLSRNWKDNVSGSKSLEAPQNKMNLFYLTLDDVEKIVIDDFCEESIPCEHDFTVFLKDGRQASGSCGKKICSIVSKIASEKINPSKTWINLDKWINPGKRRWDSNAIKRHFNAYQNEAKSAEAVLNKMFSEKK